MTRAAILEAATECADEVGWAGTSMAAVRTRAGVSNGSLFHHFPTRAALESAVLEAGLDDHQATLGATLRTDAREGVTGLVVAHCRWLDEHPALAMLFLDTAATVLRGAAGPDAVAANRAFFAEVASWLTHHGWPGTPPLPVVLALWTGPADAHGRLRLTDVAVGDASAALAAGAWAAIAPLLAGVDA